MNSPRVLVGHGFQRELFTEGLAYFAQDSKIDLASETAVLAGVHSKGWSVQMDHEKTRVFVGNDEVTNEINKEYIGNPRLANQSVPSGSHGFADCTASVCH